MIKKNFFRHQKMLKKFDYSKQILKAKQRKSLCFRTIHFLVSWINKHTHTSHLLTVLLVLLSWSTTVSSVPFLPKKDLMSLSSYQLREGMCSPPISGWPHMILVKALKLSFGRAVRFSGDRRRRAELISAKLERAENWRKRYRRGVNNQISTESLW